MFSRQTHKQTKISTLDYHVEGNKSDSKDKCFTLVFSYRNSIQKIKVEGAIWGESDEEEGEEMDDYNHETFAHV